MKRFTNLVWAAVAVLGLYSPVFSYAGSFGNFASKGAMLQGGQSSHSNSSSSNGSSFKSMPYKGGLSGQVLNQIIGSAIAWGLGIVGTIIILKICDLTIGLRVSKDQETEGLDLSQHGEEGYIYEG